MKGVSNSFFSVKINPYASYEVDMPNKKNSHILYWKKKRLVNTEVQKYQMSTCRKMKLEPCHSVSTKINIEWMWINPRCTLLISEKLL